MSLTRGHVLEKQFLDTLKDGFLEPLALERTRPETAFDSMQQLMPEDL